MTDLAERVVPMSPGDPADPVPAAPPSHRGAGAVMRLAVPAALVIVAAVLAVAAASNGRGTAAVTTGSGGGGSAAANSAGAPAATPATTPPATPPTTAHQHEAAAVKPLSPADQRVFSQQMATAREVGMRYPTVADALKAGYKRAGPFAPGAGAHYVAPDDESAKAVTGFDLQHPLAYLYSGNEPTSVVVGIMYYTLTPTAPEGFVGSNDVFHKHNGICLTEGGDGGFDTPFPVDADTTKEQCDGVKGKWMSTTGWMLHVWTAPGWESPTGVFSHDNPLVVCADGTSTIPNDKLNQGCKGT